ncbi:hypothetical protein M8494_04395 [Serratia ureilytica]
MTARELFIILLLVVLRWFCWGFILSILDTSNAAMNACSTGLVRRFQFQQQGRNSP